jgi:hypothetical protein
LEDVPALKHREPLSDCDCHNRKPSVGPSPEP